MHRSMFCVLVGCTSAAMGQPTIEYLMQTSHLYPTTLFGASADCSVITGFGLTSAGVRGWVWSDSNGQQVLPLISSEFTQLKPFGVSSDGRYLSVQNVRANSTPSRQQSRFDMQSWTHETVGFSDTNRSVDGFGISPDGGTLPLVRVNIPANQLTTWRPGQGQVGIHLFPDNAVCLANDASIGGEVIVGEVLAGASRRAFRATGSTLNFLTSLVGDQETRAVATTYDGNITVGQSGAYPVAWLQNSPVSIPALVGSNGGVASVINSDASLVGGSAYFDVEVPWIWSESTGTVRLQDYLLTLGLITVNLRSLNAVSDDGLRFVGMTNDNRLYRVTLQTPIAGLSIPSPTSLCLLASSAGLWLRRRSRR